MDAVARAEEVIRTVEGLDYVSPNSILYNSLIDCMVKSKHKDKSLQAEEILVKMEQMHRSGNPHVRPNSYAYRYAMIHVNIVIAVSNLLCDLIFLIFLSVPLNQQASGKILVLSFPKLSIPTYVNTHQDRRDWEKHSGIFQA